MTFFPPREEQIDLWKLYCMWIFTISFPVTLLQKTIFNISFPNCSLVGGTNFYLVVLIGDYWPIISIAAFGPNPKGALCFQWRMHFLQWKMVPSFMDNDCQVLASAGTGCHQSTIKCLAAVQWVQQCTAGRQCRELAHSDGSPLEHVSPAQEQKEAGEAGEGLKGAGDGRTVRGWGRLGRVAHEESKCSSIHWIWITFPAQVCLHGSMQICDISGTDLSWPIHSRC